MTADKKDKNKKLRELKIINFKIALYNRNRV